MKKKYLILLLVLSGIPFASRLLAQDTVKIDFTAMDPHVGQNLYLRVVDQSDSSEIGRTSVLIENAAFSLSVGGIIPDSSYNVDFYADFNENGEYDAPPTDHAWRIALDSVKGDTTVIFVHNTDFTDILWSDITDTLFLLTLDFSAMTPHVGQDLLLYLRSTDNNQVVDSLVISPIETADFSVEFDSVAGGSYNLDFYADFNENGMYDAPPTDHAWRIVLSDIISDTAVAFVHNTDFTDIFPESTETVYQLTVNFSAMDPHIGQDLYLYLNNIDDEVTVDSLTMSVENASFEVVFDSLVEGGNYNFDFYADHNENGMYDAPPADHAWRIELLNIQKDTVVEFVHNTDFTDIFPPAPSTVYQLSLDFSEMDPHVGQELIIYLRDPETGDFIDSMRINPVAEADFTVVFDSVAVNTDYNLDFYADLNSNGMYDVPPADHAWRIELTGIENDTTISFVHNTTFTDIGLSITAIDDPDGDAGFAAYPNPARNELNVQLAKPGTSLSVYNVAGGLVLHKSLSSADRLIKLDVSALKPGMYILKLNSDSGSGQRKFMKE